jgi:hypothetical protein
MSAIEIPENDSASEIKNQKAICEAIMRELSKKLPRLANLW